MCEVGLLQHKERPALGVSPDAIVEVLEPGAEVDAAPVAASCEIKTRLAPNRVAIAQALAVEHGMYFACAVGSDVWAKVVPQENRAQIAHQAAVCGVALLAHVLFVTASTEGIIYAVLVGVSAAARETWLQAVDKFSDRLIMWAHESLDVVGPPPPPPAAFGAASSIVSSHMRLWRAVHKLVRAHGHLRPVRLFKSAVQVYYNGVKGGIDGNTHHVSEISTGNNLNLGLEGALVVRAIKHLAVNTFCLHRLHGVVRSKSEWSSMTQYRERANRGERLKDFTVHLAVSLLRRAWSTAQSADTSTSSAAASPSAARRAGAAVAARAAEVASERPKRSAAVRAYYNMGSPMRVRLDAALQHTPVCNAATDMKSGRYEGKKRPAPLTCVVCQGRTTNCCSVCKVALHKSVPAAKRKSCFNIFHSRGQLEN